MNLDKKKTGGSSDENKKHSINYKVERKYESVPLLYNYDDWLECV